MQSYAQRNYYENDAHCASGGGGAMSAMQAGQQYQKSSSASYGGHQSAAAAAHAYQQSHQSSSQSSSMQMQQQQQQQMQKSSSFSASSQQQMMTVFGSEPFCEIRPSSFPPGTDPKIVECYNRIDRDGNGVIDDCELQSVLSSYSQSFSLRTVHLLMFQFTHSNRRMIGPKEFVPLLKCLQTWRTMFQRFDRNRDGTIDSMELGQALSALGFCVSPMIVNLLIAKFNKSGARRCSLKYDNFIECCLTVKGLTETFRAKENCGKATFVYEEFLLNVLPYIIA